VKRTYFDATFCGDGRNRRLLVVDDATAEVVATDQVPDWDAVLVIVNSTVYGGSGGKIAVLSLDTEAVNLALHELGHSVFQLADEYDSLPGCGRGGRRRLRRPQVRRAARAQRHRQHRPRHPEVAAAGRPDHAATDQPQRQLPPVQPAGQPTAARHGRALRGGGRLPLRRLPARVRLQAADPARPLLRGVPAPHPAEAHPPAAAGPAGGRDRLGATPAGPVRPRRRPGLLPQVVGRQRLGAVPGRRLAAPGRQRRVLRRAVTEAAVPAAASQGRARRRWSWCTPSRWTAARGHQRPSRRAGGHRRPPGGRPRRRPGQPGTDPARTGGPAHPGSRRSVLEKGVPEEGLEPSCP
jgi:hypothetical protein